MRKLLIAVLGLHGAIHLLGFAKGFGLASITALSQPISRSQGALWLLAGAAFLTSAILLSKGPRQWAIPALPALVVSQVVIFASWSDARFGTLANCVIAVPLAIALIDLRPGGLRSMYETEIERGLARPRSVTPVTEADLRKLPQLVAGYLRRVGVVGRPRVVHLRANWKTEMKPTRDGVFRSGRAEQVEFFDQPTRLFLMEQAFYGLPTEALHRYIGRSATMKVRVASLLDVVDARGPEMDQSETVTLFNDMCLLAPSTLIDADVRFTELDRHTVRGVFTNAGHTISADLRFDDEGDLVDFVSNDRYRSADGKTYELLPWSTPVVAYRDFDGRRLPSRAEARWIEPGGEFVYARFELEDLTCDAEERPLPLVSRVQGLQYRGDGEALV